MKTSRNIETVEKCHAALRQFAQIVILLNLRYSKESDIEEIPYDCIVNFMNENNFEGFAELFEEVEKTEINNLVWYRKEKTYLYKLVTLVYLCIMNFPSCRLEIKTKVRKS